MDTTGLITFFTAILTAAVAIAGLLAAVALAASGLMYFGVVGHSQRAMEQAQNGVRAFHRVGPGVGSEGTGQPGRQCCRANRAALSTEGFTSHV
jgi:hypothetical protein